MKEQCLNDICESANRVASWINAYTARGCEACDCDELGAVADVAKDLIQAKKDYAEAMYYEAVTKAMEETEDDSDLYGYNPNRWSNGRFAPGYPMMRQEEYMKDYLTNPEEFRSRMRRGYHDDAPDANRYGYEYGRYQDAKRHFTQTKSVEDKELMMSHGNAHVSNMINSFRDMWRDADPELRKSMKSSMTTVLNELA